VKIKGQKYNILTIKSKLVIGITRTTAMVVIWFPNFCTFLLIVAIKFIENNLPFVPIWFYSTLTIQAIIIQIIHCRLKTHSRSCILIHEIHLQKGFPYLSLELTLTHLSLSSYLFSPFSHFHPILLIYNKKVFLLFWWIKKSFVEKLHIFFILSLIHTIPIHILLHSNSSTDKNKRKFTGSFLFLCNCFFHYFFQNK
jgi:hypothetical protein